MVGHLKKVETGKNTNTALFIFAGLFFMFYFLSVTPHLDGGDTLVYLSGAEGISEGKGYVDDSTPFEAPITIYPPLLSFFISFFFLAESNAIMVSKIALAAVAAATVIISVKLYERFMGKDASLALAAITGVSLLFYWYSTKILSDLPFLFMTLASMHFFLSSADRGFKDRSQLGISLFLLCISFYLRTVAVVLAAAMVAYLLMKGKRNNALAFVAVFGIVFITWFAYASIHQSNDSYLDQFLRADVHNPDSGIITPFDLAARLFSNAVFYFFYSIPETVFSPLQLLGQFAGRAFILPFGLAVLLAMVWGVLEFTERHGRNVLLLFCGLYLAFMLFWGYRDESAVNRFLLPVLPILVMIFYYGLVRISALTRLGEFKVAGHGIAAVLLLLVFISSLGAGAYFIYTLDARENTQHYADLEESAVWLKQNARQGNYIYGNEWQRLHFMSGLKGFAGRTPLESNELSAFIGNNGFDYVVVTSLGWPEKETLQGLYA